MSGETYAPAGCGWWLTSARAGGEPGEEGEGGEEINPLSAAPDPVCSD